MAKRKVKAAINNAKETSPAAHLTAHQFQPGQVANPAGRPKGSRNKLGESFLADMLADWEENGAAVIKTVRADRPQDYLKVVASILPKELNVKLSDFDEMTDEELDRRIKQLAVAVADEIGTGEVFGGEAATTSAQQARPI